ncbi:tetratricopeptide repeat protein [Leptobacterium sp. I13]|uniref:tetratricopeptide repeat-containing sensor histidine kinase n=1 Tax=Leptobacterium meishanense TaxID=3128904 RepID=UPI0030EED8BD
MKSSYYLTVFSVLLFATACKKATEIAATGTVQAQDSLALYLQYAKEDTLSVAEKATWIDKGRGWATKQPDSVQAKARLQIALCYYRIGSLKQFQAESQQALELAQKEKDTLHLATANRYLGTYCLRKNVNDSAYYFFYNAQNHYRSLNDVLNTGKMLLNMGIVQKNALDYVGAEATTVEAITFLENTEDIRMLASAYNNLAFIASEMENYEASLNYDKEAYNLRRKLDIPWLEITSLNNIGTTYEQMGQYKEAITYYDQALAYPAIRKEQPEVYARLLSNRAHARFLLGDTTGLPEAYMEPLVIRDSLNDYGGKMSSRLHLAEYHEKMQDTVMALYYANEVYGLAAGVYNYGDMLKPLQIMARLGKGNEAKGYAARYIQISDSLQQAERQTRNQFARIRFDTDKLEKLNIVITRKMNWYMYTAISAILLGLLLVIIIRQRLKNKKLEFEQLQQQANEEVYNLMLSQQDRVEEAREKEQERISKELHDGVQSRMFSIFMMLGNLNDDTSEEAISKRKVLIAEIQKISKDIRKISHDLQESIFDERQAYSYVINGLMDLQLQGMGINYKLDDQQKIDWDEVPYKTKMHLYRVIQEALQNVVKYAEAKSVTITFDSIGEWARIIIADDGKGFDKEKVKKGIGIKNMKSRIAEIEGSIECFPEIGKGTTIIIKISAPLLEKNDNHSLTQKFIL